jgi:hypothetical protein
MDPSDVEFNPLNMYGAKPELRNEIVNLVVAAAPPGSVYATVV